MKTSHHLLAIPLPRTEIGRCFAIVLMIGALLSTGCTTVSRTTSQAVALLLQKPHPPAAANVAALPYPQLWLEAPDMAGTLVLAHVDGERQVWFAGHEAVLYLRPDGLVSGMTSPRLKVETRILSGAPFARLPLDDDVIIRREYDWMPGYRDSVIVTGRLHRAGMDQIDILGHVLSLARYEEQLDGPGLNATNTYWIDENRDFMWKSRQTLAPGYTVEITQLKPYRPASTPQ